MTAEVAILNQHALVMAADSATTVTIWAQGERQTRYFKGANKLFQLSAHHPVGLMIYNSALLHGVPWELLVKDFRVHLGNDSCDRLGGYSQRFFEFIESHTALFPDNMQTELFMEQITDVALRIGYQVAAQEGIRGRAGTYLGAAFGGALELLLTELKSTTPKIPIGTADLEAAVATHAQSAASEIANDPLRFRLPDGQLAPMLAEVAIRTLMVDNH
jgi:hypothetical protein